MMLQVVRWLAIIAFLAAMGWVGAIEMQAAETLLIGQRLDLSVLAPSSYGYREAVFVTVLGLMVVADWLVRRRTSRSARLLNGAGYNMVYVLADLTGATRAAIIVFTAGIACIAIPAVHAIPGYLGLAQVPWLLQVVLAYMAGTFTQYWYHRFMHTRLMWPLHAVHHSDRAFGILTTNRHHPIEAFIFQIAIVGAIAPLGIEITAAATAMVPAAAVSVLQHSHLPFPLWAERWIFIGPAAHRIHHSNAREHYDRNFGTLAIWDRLFGTFALPPDARQVTTGIDDSRYDTGRPFHELFVAVRIWLAGLSAAIRPRKLDPKAVAPGSIVGEAD
jgi:sterol desaturase/sphingolipid hydroxylase (fatty acid hydroxylase superfamily)